MGLRPADGSSDRVVVRTRFGEKSLKYANLQSGKSVIARSAWAIGLVLGMLAVAATVDVFRTGGHGYLAIATPLVCGIWLLATSFLCLWLYWPGCKPPDTW